MSFEPTLEYFIQVQFGKMPSFLFHGWLIQRLQKYEKAIANALCVEKEPIEIWEEVVPEAVRKEIEETLANEAVRQADQSDIPF